MVWKRMSFIAVLLVLFAAVGVAIGRYRDGDQKTRAAMRNLLNRVRQ